MENTGAGWQGFLSVALIQLLFHIPTIAVYIVGIVISFIKYKNHPRVSLLSGIGFAILLILSIVSALITVLPLYFYGQKYSAQNIGYIVSTIGFFTTFIAAAASALLLSAVWKNRA